MGKRLVIKVYKTRKQTRNRCSNIIVVSVSPTKANGGWILDKIGVFGYFNNNINNLKTKIICSINLKKLGYWLNKGAVVKSKPSWLIGLLSKNDNVN